jgi:hypothetical protein
MTKNMWQNLSNLFPPTRDEENLAQKLITEWKARGYIKKTSTDLLNIPDKVIIAFYSTLSQNSSIHSPHRSEPNSSWFTQNDITFYNVRATGLGSSVGNFLQASKLILGERAHCIHIAPFTRYDHNTIYSIVAARSPAEELWHPALVDKNILPLDQVRLFVQAIHLLGKAAGYDLEPHTAQFSYLALEHPEAFRWIKVYTPDPRWLDYYFTQETVYSIENQKRIISEVRGFVHEFLHQAKISTFDEEPFDTYPRLKLKHQTFQQARDFLIRYGYWTVPSHAWNGYGVPRFKGYNLVHNYPEFTYRDRNGADISQNAYHILTPFCFWDGLPAENSWGWENQARSGRPNQYGIKLYHDLFLFWRDEMEFDFVRFDSVDHIWDSCDPTNPTIPFSDRPTPSVLRDCILSIRSPNRLDIGTLAERIGDEIRAYETLGFDVILGSSMMEDPSLKMFEHDIKISEELNELNAKRPFNFSVCVALDTHDTGNPLFRGKSLIELEGYQGLLLRLFLARFLQGGTSFRPLYGVMGLTDLSYGLFPANVSCVNLHWSSDETFLNTYHLLEDLYLKFKSTLNHGLRFVKTANYVGASWIWQSSEWELYCEVCFPGGGFYQTQFQLEGLEGYTFKQERQTLCHFSPILGEQEFQIAWRQFT